MILDLRMVEDQMKSWDLLMLARADPDLREVPLIVSSADVVRLLARAEEFQRVGNVHPLEKPFGMDDVLAAVDHAMAPARQPADGVGRPIR